MDRPNVILLLADDVGYGDLSPYGEPTIYTPQVERLAQRGLRFTDAHSVAATSTPSRYSLLTGHYSWRRNDTGVAAGNAGMIIRPKQQTVADLFRMKGYVTGAVGKWHLGGKEYFPEKFGFDVNIGGNAWGLPIYGYFSPYTLIKKSLRYKRIYYTTFS